MQTIVDEIRIQNPHSNIQNPHSNKIRIQRQNPHSNISMTII
jgi:hypothetical protein